MHFQACKGWRYTLTVFAAAALLAAGFWPESGAPLGLALAAGLGGLLLIARPPRPAAPALASGEAEPVAAAAVDEREPTPVPRVSAWELRPSSLQTAVLAFQNQAGDLLLDAEATRAQAESCERGLRAVANASRGLGATCDVLARRAGLTQSHALMGRCSTAEALEAARGTMHLLEELRSRQQGGESATTVELDAISEQLSRTLEALHVGLERGDETVRVASALGGAASRSERHARSLGEACESLAPSLADSTRGALRVSMLAAELDDNAGRLGRRLEASAADLPSAGDVAPAPTPRRPSAAVATSEPGDNVVWVQFRGTTGRATEAEHA